MRDSVNEGGPAHPHPGQAARIRKARRPTASMHSRAASGSCNARDHDWNRRDQLLVNDSEAAGVACPPQGPRRPHHDQPEPVHRGEKLRADFTRGICRARDIRLVGADRRSRTFGAAPAR